MAKKKTKPMTTDEFRQMERAAADEAGKAALERMRRGKAEAEDARRRKALANRTMDQIVEAAMTPPEAVMLPTDFAAAWASDRPMFLKLINRALTAEETKGVAGAMATLMEHNRRLRLLAKDLLDRLETACAAANGIAADVRSKVTGIREAWIAGEKYIDVEDD